MERDLTADIDTDIDNDIDIDQEVEKFRNELRSGKYILDNLSNDEEDYNNKKSERDLAAFDEFLKSDTFKALEDRGIL